MMNQWLKKVKNVAYEADNLLDEYSYEVLKRRIEQRFRTGLRAKIILFFSSSNPAVFRMKISHRVSDLMNSVDEIYKEANDLGIKPIQVASGYTYCNSGSDRSHESEERRLRNRRQWVDEEGLIGRDTDISAITKLVCDLSNMERALTIIGIVGFAGLGKTALSKRISKTEQVTEYFNCQIIWLVVSHKFDLVDILNKLVENLYGSASTMSDSSALVNKVRERLKGKRYLLILDDVWNTTDWEPLRCALKEVGGTNGTCILTTSRNKNVVAKMETYCYGEDDRMTIQEPFIYELQGLEKKESWSLFEKRVGHGHLESKEKQLIGRRMMLCCKGVPLAIRALGDMLRNQSLKKWKEIEISELWEKEDRYGIMPSLELSYHYLPDMYLKRCFSYCAIFKEDEEISKDNLIQLWMAQGFLLPYSEMEAIGDQYFDILLDSSLFQDAKLDIIGNVKSFKIHDLVLSLARNVSGGECLNLVETNDDHILEVKQNTELSDVTHLSTMRNTSENNFNPEFLNKLRTCYYAVRGFELGRTFSECILVHCQQLRSLCLQRLALEDLPESFGSLKHLRYLDISGNKFKKLPIRVTKLYQLQTLRIENNYGGFPVLSEEVTTLVSLRHIICSAGWTGIGVPKGLGKLTALRSLPPIYMEKKWGGSVTELEFLNSLRGRLEINRVDFMKVEEARSLHLESKLNIEQLVLNWQNYGISVTNLVESKSQNKIIKVMKPHENLAEVEINYYCGTKFPQWLTTPVAGSLRNIVSLKLSFCTYAEGNLNLENLTSLRFLTLICCSKLTISFTYRGFEYCKFLEELKITFCDAVSYLPDMSPLNHLRKLEILYCPIMTQDVFDWTNLFNLREVSTDTPMPTNRIESPVYKSLQRLVINGRRMETLPEQIWRFRVLKHLEISFFNKLKTLPDCLDKLTLLCTLTLKSLPLLNCLPSESAMEGLSNLEFIDIVRCPVLVEQLNKRGAEWLKIAHVTKVRM
ncbi:putative disease resistance protein RGA4 isoform X2 [Silene latifolia]